MSVGTCKICDRNSKIGTCSLCQVKGCKTCLDSHQASCSVMKEHHFHMCKVDRDQQVCGYCHHCSELICENCRYVHHNNHVIVPMKTAVDNIRKDMPKVGQDIDMKYDQLKMTMGIQEKDHLLSQQKMGTSIKPTNQHLQLELLQEAKTNFDFLGNESFPLAFLSRWSCVQHALTKYKQLHSTTTESPQSHEQMTSHVPDVSQTFGNSVMSVPDKREAVNLKKDMTQALVEGEQKINFVDNMELILNRVTSMKKEMLTTEGNLAATIAHVAKWMDEQRQTEKGLNREIQDKAKTIHEQDKELKIRLSRIQEIQKINSVYEGMKNENNKLRQQIHDNEKKADQQQRNQSHVNDELKRSLHHMNTELQQRAANIESLQRAMQDLRYQIDQKDDKIKDIKREAEDLQTRLNSLAGDKIIKGTPAITDLGDPNRPMKLAERYVELYDNEWTDAIDPTVEMKALYPDKKAAEIEEVIIRHLYQLVMCCYRECLAMSKEQLKDVGNMIVNALKLNTKRHGRNIPCCKEVSNIRRQGAAEYADYLFKHKVIVDKIVLSDWEYVHKSKELVGLLTETPFFEKCIHLCWHMAIKDPVMHLDEELILDTAHDTSVYREFGKNGDKVKFVVWPALFLHEGGPLLNKGVVQAYC